MATAQEQLEGQLEEQLETIRLSITRLFGLYNEAMRDGNDLLLLAAKARLEHEHARDNFKGNKKEAHARHGKSATTDVRYASMAVAQEDLGDNRWFITQHPGYAAEATAHFARATALMSAIQYEMLKLKGLIEVHNIHFPPV